jgi:hypothetical protein
VEDKVSYRLTAKEYDVVELKEVAWCLLLTTKIEQTE